MKRWKFIKTELTRGRPKGIRADIKNPDRICIECGGSFIAKSGPQKYCKVFCQHKNFVRRHGGAGNYIREIHGMSGWAYYTKMTLPEAI
jgi:hypothetical protein